jgi:hypothetical protein
MFAICCIQPKGVLVLIQLGLLKVMIRKYRYSPPSDPSTSSPSRKKSTQASPKSAKSSKAKPKAVVPSGKTGGGGKEKGEMWDKDAKVSSEASDETKQKEEKEAGVGEEDQGGNTTAEAVEQIKAEWKLGVTKKPVQFVIKTLGYYEWAEWIQNHLTNVNWSTDRTIPLFT